MPFDDHAFISYGHIDNMFSWINNLHERLEYRLGELMGVRASVWRDTRMPGNVYIAAHLEGRIKKTIVLVSVLSPGYIKSNWCKGELSEFCRLARENGGLEVDGRVRLFKVIKTPVEGEHPEELRNLSGYEFYEIDQASERIREFNQDLDPRTKDQRYWDKLDDLAQDIKKLLDSAGGNRPQAPARNPQPGTKNANGNRFVYLAETTRDLTAERDGVKRELQQHGFEVLPDREIPYISPHYEQTVQADLARCKLSIHLIGRNYGAIPEGAGDRSIVRLQNELAAARSNTSNLSRLIWMPAGLTDEPIDDRQTQFINSLITSADLQRGAELLQTGLEDLKTVIQRKLSSNGHKPAVQPPGQRRKRIYLICDRRDVEGVAPLTQFLRDHHYEVRLPLIDDENSDGAQAIEIHNDNLLQCDAILIYYGKGSQSWIFYKLKDLDKVAGLETIAGKDRAKPLLAKAVFISDPETDHKRLFDTDSAPIINGPGAFKPEYLQPFIDELEAGGRGGDDGDDGND